MRHGFEAIATARNLMRKPQQRHGQPDAHLVVRHEEVEVAAQLAVTLGRLVRSGPLRLGPAESAPALGGTVRGDAEGNVDTAQLATDFMSAITRADRDGLGRLFREDAVTEWLDFMVLEGRRHCVGVYRNDAKRYSPFTTEVVEVLFADETRAMFRCRVKGTEVAPLTTAKRTYPMLGRSFTIDGFVTIDCVEGQIARLVYAFNPMAVFTQLGHLEPL